ncbi:hypothetical protein AB1Y20_004738 [Prymnesium parvum]|uniref:JmjC domain-containing protein n=1 Tax=Prymnesium parvum TaxID=97485 RepID=A0AB34IXC6_PRYPA
MLPHEQLQPLPLQTLEAHPLRQSTGWGVAYPEQSICSRMASCAQEWPDVSGTCRLAKDDCDQSEPRRRFPCRLAPVSVASAIDTLSYSRRGEPRCWSTMVAMSGKECVREMKELRRLISLTDSAYVQKLLSAALEELTRELQLDVDELRTLEARAATSEVRAMLKKEIAELSPHLEGAEATAKGTPADGAAADSIPAAEGKAGMAPLITQPREPPKPSAPPAGVLDPLRWSPSDCASLPAECWRPSDGTMRQVPRCAHDSAEARQLMAEGKPVVLTHAPLVASATGKWDLDYLVSNLGEQECTVFQSGSTKFRYWDPAKVVIGEQIPPQTERLTMKASEFAAAVRGAEKGGSKLYLQTPLVQGVGEAMVADFKQFDWAALREWQKRNGWGEMTSNLLLVGQRGNTTPAHYDEQQNIFAQLRGRKHVVLFSPADFRCLYPFPLAHPNDRQSQVDFDAPDLARFPRFTEAQAFDVTLEPGELLFIPQYWWHHIQNLDDECVSVTFWFKDLGGNRKVALPLSPTQHVAMRRNVEKLLLDGLGLAEARRLLGGGSIDAASPPADAPEELLNVRTLLAHVMPPEQIAPWLAELVDGRYR